MAKRGFLPGAALVLVLVLALVAPRAMADELHVYAGAGLRQPVSAIADLFKAETGTDVVIEFGGSGQIMARYAEAGEGDVFVPGSTFYSDKLAEKGLVRSTRLLVEHGPVLAVTKAKAGEITTFADLAKPGVRLGLGDPEAMALGRTAEDILKASGMAKQILPNVAVRAATVKQLALYVFDGDVDAAIIAASDAAMNPDKVAIVAIPKEWYTAEIVPVVVLTTAKEPEAAEAFAEKLASDEGRAVWERFGFTPVARDAE
ncbi:molybdate ABC transporter substrate-binding protein [Afifella sp. H1R]|uniref:molybdate ABC transporter substrate-binding protein n=1 Tax=Afifella sp. H1R TaxID=2908841 RepID=UPI001F32F5C9|nr:molybdate ABC transporter substrate-binding protein [Afifella sp. H1R]MCF1503702.1 molybdate ABC transporter substrate-binding protein [Afifella sp. H1R]